MSGGIRKASLEPQPAVHANAASRGSSWWRARPSVRVSVRGLAMQEGSVPPAGRLRVLPLPQECRVVYFHGSSAVSTLVWATGKSV